MFGTLKLKLNEPSVPTVAEPTDVPLKVTSAFSAGLKPVPLAVTWSPGTPDDADIARLGFAAGIGVMVVPGVPGVPVAWPSAVAGSASSAPRSRTTTTNIADPIAGPAGSEELWGSL